MCVRASLLVSVGPPQDSIRVSTGRRVVIPAVEVEMHMVQLVIYSSAIQGKWHTRVLLLGVEHLDAAADVFAVYT